MLLLIITGIIFNIQFGTFSSSFSTIQDPEIFWIGYFLFLLSTLAHEFGHSSASRRYGAIPIGIGFTFYLVFPALYSDVTNSWKLKSGQRAIVGLGGMYFQLIIAACYTFIGIGFNVASFKIAVLMIFGNCILNLNPFFKFDGYWILSDLLGVLNLSRQPLQIFKFLNKHLRGVKSASLPWSGWISLFVGIYSVGTIFIAVYFISRYSAYFWTGIQQYPSVFQKFTGNILSGKSINFEEMHAFFLSSLTLVIFISFLYNVVFTPLIKKLRSS